MIDRYLYREMFSKRLGLPVLSYKACRILEAHGIVEPELLKPWLIRPSVRLIKGFGIRTYNEILAGCGMAVPAKAPTTLGAKLRAAEARIATLEEQLRQANADGRIL